MDIQFWLTIIIFVIYFLSRVLKKQEPETPKKVNVPKTRPEKAPYGRVEKPVTETPKTLTFEDLLREITEAKQPPKPVYQPQPEPRYVNYDEEIGEEEQSIESVDYDYRKEDKRYEEYEEAKRQAFYRPSLEETMKLGDSPVLFGKFKEFEQSQQKDLLAEYTKDFRDPEGLKKAIVMGEILNRRFQY